MNKGTTTIGTDEIWTPDYAVIPILKYIPPNVKVWLPFDEEWSAYNRVLKAAGIDVIRTSLAEGYDFFEYEPSEPYDMIISNGPFSKKDKVLERLYDLGKPFALLLPLNSLQGQRRYEMFKHGVQILCFDRRIEFGDNHGVPFASAYFCKDILPKDLIVEKLLTK